MSAVNTVSWFEIGAPDVEAAKAFYDRLGLVKRLVNIGDVKSLACHPASTTHRQLSRDELLAAGIRPEMIRLSIGLEHVDDLIDDIDQALAQAVARSGSRDGPSAQ